MVGPRRGAKQLGDVPRPERFGPCREQLGLGIDRSTTLVASLAHLLVRGEKTIHRALGAVVGALVKERRDDLDRCLVDKARRVKQVEDLPALVDRERAGRHSPSLRPVDRHLPTVVTPALVRRMPARGRASWARAPRVRRAPLDEMRAEEAFAAEHGADGAGLGIGVDLREERALELRAEGASRGFGANLGRRDYGALGVGHRHGSCIRRPAQ